MRLRTLSVLTLVLFVIASCQKSRIERSAPQINGPRTAADDSIAAKMLSYGFKPYTGPIDSTIRNLPHLTLEQAVQKLESWKKVISKKAPSSLVSPQDATPGQGYIDDGNTIYYSGNAGSGNSYMLTYLFPSFQTVGIPYLFDVSGTYDGTVYQTSFYGGGGNWNYFYQNYTSDLGVGPSYTIYASESALLAVGSGVYYQTYRLTLNGSQGGAHITLNPSN